MNFNQLDASQSSPVAGGRYFKENGVWIWDEIDSVVSDNYYTERQLHALLDLALAIEDLNQAINYNFWPEDITPEEIKHLYDADHPAASHYTLARRNSDGDVIARAYIEEFPSEVASIIRILDDMFLSHLFINDSYVQTYLYTVKKALEDTDIQTRRPDSWDAVDRVFATTNDTKQLLYVHPLESYQDPMQEKLDLTFSGEDDPWKYSFDMAVFSPEPLLDDTFMRKFEEVLSQAYNDGKSLPHSPTLFVNYVMLTGRNAEKPNRGQTIPNDPTIANEHGRVTLMFANSIRAKALEFSYPYAERYLTNIAFTPEELQNAFLLEVLAHETAHNIKHGTVTWLEEIKATAMGLSPIGMYASKGVLDALNTTPEALNATLLLHAFEAYEVGGATREYYYTGENMVLNYFLEHGALAFNDDRTKVTLDYDKVPELTSVFTDLILDLYKHRDEDDFAEQVKDFRGQWSKVNFGEVLLGL